MLQETALLGGKVLMWFTVEIIYFFFKEKDLGKHRCMSINRKRTKGLVCAHMTGEGFGSNLHV